MSVGLCFNAFYGCISNNKSQFPLGIHTTRCKTVGHVILPQTYIGKKNRVASLI